MAGMGLLLFLLGVAIPFVVAGKTVAILVGVLVLTDGVLACLIFACCAGGGWAILSRWKHDAKCLPVALGVGLGIFMLAVLGLGLAGMLNRWALIGLLGVMGVSGIVVGIREEFRFGVARDGAKHIRWIAFALAGVGVGLAVMGASTPPGMMWTGEGGGYDVLEYHLQVPREWFRAGRITFLPHNVYSNMPMNMEMLYLAADVLGGGEYEGMYLAQYLNLLVGISAAWAVVTLARGNILAGALVVTAPWWLVVSSLAYNENGLLLFGALALLALRRQEMVLAGIFLGLACGCKYTAAIMIVPGVLFAGMMIHPPRQIPRMVIRGLLACIIVWSPWLIKNGVFTGNPIFPLASSWFGAEDRDEVFLAQRWDRGHRPPAEQATLTGRLKRFNEEVLTHPRYGLLFLPALGGLFVKRPNRWAVACWGMLGLQIAAWAGLTHLAGRFFIPALIPLTVLTGLAAEGEGWKVKLFRVLALGVVGVNACQCLFLYAGQSHRFAPIQGMHEVIGDDLTPHLAYVHRNVPGEARILLVGEATPFYWRRKVVYNTVFNRCRLADLADRSPKETRKILDQLRKENIDYLFVHWSEIGRLRRTYGFWPHINRSLFDRLTRAGLVREKVFLRPRNYVPYAELYRIPEEKR